MLGVVERIAPQAVIKNGIKGFATRIAIKDIDPRVRPGMTALLSIPVSSADNVLAVPLAAVFTERGERFVFVKNEDQYERRTIVLGVTDYAFAEVVQGLSSGEIVSLEQKVNSVPGAPSAPGSTNSGDGRKGARRAEAATTSAPTGRNQTGGSSSTPATSRPAIRATGS